MKKKAYCTKCWKEVYKCDSWRDGEHTYVGYYPCPKHPNANIRFMSDEESINRTLKENMT